MIRDQKRTRLITLGNKIRVLECPVNDKKHRLQIRDKLYLTNREVFYLISVDRYLIPHFTEVS